MSWSIIFVLVLVYPDQFLVSYDPVKGFLDRRGAIFNHSNDNLMNPIHGQDLAEVCVDTAEGDEIEVEAGGPDIMTQREAAELAFEVAGKPAKITVIPMWMARGLARFIGLLSKQFGDLAEFIVTAGEIDGVGPRRGKTTLRSYFESLHGASREKG